MANEPDFDVTAADKHFASHCFNAAWDLIDKPHRSPEEDRLLVELSQASLYHWRNRPDCTNKNLSVGYWQASRIQCLLGNAVEATRHAEACLGYCEGLEPFYLGYAYEALARAAVVAAARDKAAQHLDKARAESSRIQDTEHRAMLDRDLDDVASMIEETPR